MCVVEQNSFQPSAACLYGGDVPSHPSDTVEIKSCGGWGCAWSGCLSSSYGSRPAFGASCGSKGALGWVSVVGCAFRSRGWPTELLSSERMFSRLWRFELLPLKTTSCDLEGVWAKQRRQSLGWLTGSDWSLFKALQSPVVLWGQASVLRHSLRGLGGCWWLLGDLQTWFHKCACLMWMYERWK